MSGNAPEELRDRIDELEATVRGLTQELVEANERIRRLEEETEAAGGARQGYDEDEEPADKPMPAEDGGTDERDAAEAGDDEGGDDDEVGDDIIVA